MKICALSDTHGIIDINKLNIKADILCIAGDFIPLYTQRNIIGSRYWFIDEFIPSLQKIDVEEIYLIAGNHDFLAERDPEFIRTKLIGTKITYLQDQSAEYRDSDGTIFTIYGTPWCHLFGNWAFMYSDNKLEEFYSSIPKNLDILVTHDPPKLGTVGTINEGYNKDINVGNEVLAKEIIKKSPKLVLSGHIHSGNHTIDEIKTDDGITKLANVSLLNESYIENYKPLYLEMTSSREIKILK